MSIPPDVYQKLVDAKVFIDANFREPIDLDAIAGEACLSRFHFHRLFRRVYRRTPHQYLTFKRIDHARQMLGASDCTLSEVCAQVGFESIGSFSMLFKKETGIPPGEYREAEKGRRAAAAEQPRTVIPYCHIAQISGENSNNRESGDGGKE